MEHLLVSLIQDNDDGTCQAALSTGTEHISLPGAQTPQQACTDAAAALRAMADKLDHLAQSGTPLSTSTQFRINHSCAIDMTAATKAVLPDYRHVGGGLLTTLQHYMLDVTLNTEAARPLLSTMSTKGRGLLDACLVAMAGITCDALDDVCARTGVNWGQALDDALMVDQDNPCKETGHLLRQWGEISIDSPALDEVDRFFEALCDTSMTNILSGIACEIEFNI